MANEDKKDFNAMLHAQKDMPRIQEIYDEGSIARYGGRRMLLAPAIDYDRLIRRIPWGQVATVGQLRTYLATQYGADFTDPITAGIFVSIASWASEQRTEDKIPWWRVLKANGTLNSKLPGGAEKQKALLEQEGHTVVQKGRTKLVYVVQDYEKAAAGL